MQWDPNVKGICGNQKVSFLVIKSMGMILDLMLLLYPIPIIRDIHLTLKRKVSTVIILDAGCL
jgi:hypothetical protein